MLTAMTRVTEWQDVDHGRFVSEIGPAYQPAVLRGLVGEWPAVRLSRSSGQELAGYLATFDTGTAVGLFVGEAESQGRFFYADDMNTFNFQRQQGRLSDLLTYLLSMGSADGAPPVYMGAAPVPALLPGFELQNAMPILTGKPAVPRIWIGNRTMVSTHFDTSDNIACVVAGKRRFVLFPPEQVENLYVGPLDNTMAGQPTSMVSFNDPDMERYPRYKAALEAALVAELEPGDAIFIPALWWHHVEAVSPFNVLVNYWSDDSPPDAGKPFEALIHGLFAIGHLPEVRREAWRSYFDQFVFRKNGDPAEHIPIAHQGILAASTPELRARIRNFLLKMLSRI